MPLSTRRRAFDTAAVALIILCLLGAAAPDFYRVRDVRTHRDLLRDINDAQQAYIAAHPHAGYACSLEELAEAGLLDPDRGSGQEAGLQLRSDSDGRIAYGTESYNLHLNCRGRRSLHRAYWLYAEPRRADRPWLCSDDSGVVLTELESLLKCRESLSDLHPPATPTLP